MIYMLFFISENIQPTKNNSNQKNAKEKLSPEEEEILIRGSVQRTIMEL